MPRIIVTDPRFGIELPDGTFNYDRWFYAIDDSQRCHCGRRPAGVGRTKAEALASLAKIRPCTHEPLNRNMDTSDCKNSEQ